ncbi:MAG: hypothetical protein ACOYBQ_09930 [Fluviibacter sp.]
MPITPEQLLAQAKSISLTGEPEIRNAVGRGYYAAYHVAKSFHDGLPSFGIAPSGVGAHEGLIQRLTNPTIPRSHPLATKSRQVGYILRTIKPSRVKSDYHLSETVESNLAQQTISDAEKLMQIV